MKYVVSVNCAALTGAPSDCASAGRDGTDRSVPSAGSASSAPGSTPMRPDVCGGALEKIEVSRLDEPQPQRAHGLDALLGEQVVVEVLDPGNAVPAGVRLHDLAMRVDGLGRDRLVARAIDVQDRDAFQLARRGARLEDFPNQAAQAGSPRRPPQKNRHPNAQARPCPGPG